jgi:peptidoglycan/xylan/chitin deacetylase (PgdA/CDA1 family)
MHLAERLIKLSISALYYAGTELSDSVKSLVGTKRRSKVVILMYHSIPRERLPEFQRQVQRMNRIGRILPLDKLEEAPGGERSFAITFDDGYRSTVENGLALLEEMGIPSTMFIPSGSLGRRLQGAGDTTHGYYHDSEDTVIDESSLRNLSLEIGSHSVSHRRLTQLPSDEALKELEDSKQSLEKILEKPVRFMSFPYNSYDDHVLSLSRLSGYEKVFAAAPIPDNHPEAGYLFGRIDISPQDWPVESLLKLQGAYNWLCIATTFKRKLRTNLRKLRRSGSPRIEYDR